MSRTLAWHILEDVGVAIISATVAFYICKKKGRSPRKPRTRVQEFASNRTGTSVSLSGELVQAAHCLLANSLEQRKQGVWRERDNHSSLYTPGVIAMVVTAVDAWLNEIIGHSRNVLSEERIGELVGKSTIVDKYRDIARELSGKPLTVPSDFRLLIALRNEIVHFLPYVQLVTSGNTVPNWLGELGRKRLLISTGNPTAEFHLSQKLCSYALGYWGCQTVHLAAEALVPSLGQNPIGAVATNFGFYQQVTAPADLGPYDHRFGLTLSR